MLPQNGQSASKKIYDTLKEEKYNLGLTPVTFVGGGAKVMELFGDVQRENISYIEDVRANAIGYEYLANNYLHTKGL